MRKYPSRGEKDKPWKGGERALTNGSRDGVNSDVNSIGSSEWNEPRGKIFWNRGSRTARWKQSVAYASHSRVSRVSTRTDKYIIGV